MDGTPRYFAQCIECVLAYNNEYRKKNREKIRIRHTDLRSMHTLEALIKIAPDGEPKCAICGFKEDQRLLQIDHIHDNGALDKQKNGRRKTGYMIVTKINHMSVEEAQSEYQILCVVHNWIKRYGEKGENLAIMIKPNI